MDPCFISYRLPLPADVYREMLSGRSDRAVFLHRGSGRKWELATNQLRLKRECCSALLLLVALGSAATTQ